MTSLLNWQEFLQATAQPSDTNCLCARNTRHALVRVTGADAENFLHAQLSNAVMGLSADEVRFAAWCNAKGRVWTLLHIWKDQGAFILRMPADQVEATLKRLRMFVLRSDVQLEPLAWQSLQFIGPDAEAEAASAGCTYNIPLPGTWPCQETWGPTAVTSELPELNEKHLALPRILAGIPEVFADQREAWIPQMLNLDKLNGIDFKKGCYPGQEIVAKLHYKGGLKQRLIRAQLKSTGAAPEINELLTDAEGNKVATVIEVASTPDMDWFLAVARLDAISAPIFYNGLRVDTVEPE